MAYLPIGRDGVYRLLKNNEIPHKRVGHKYLIPKERFFEWLNATDICLHMDGTVNTTTAHRKVG